jgi:hypothetical protein
MREALEEAQDDHLLLVVCELADGRLHVLRQGELLRPVGLLEPGVVRFVFDGNRRAARTAPEVVGGEVTGDAVEPGRERRAAKPEAPEARSSEAGRSPVRR